ncbi:Mov34/MPN/PAD-1 family protein [Promineifilum sp.]|uniref:Mov34/MPN/PAD-1 family protein n=1 Tax=Promineifilum sp. TaxID=2664178 RepID=UPI0035B2D287
MLILTNELHQSIRAHGAASYPYEGCGLLLGRAEDSRNVVLAIQPLPNVWPVESEKPERFRIAEDDWRDAELEAMGEGLDVIGIFHSHPDHPPVASPRDLAWASWPGYSYLITQVIAGQPGLSRSWQLTPDRGSFVEEEIEEAHAKTQRTQSLGSF